MLNKFFGSLLTSDYTQLPMFHAHHTRSYLFNLFVLFCFVWFCFSLIELGQQLLYRVQTKLLTFLFNFFFKFIFLLIHVLLLFNHHHHHYDDHQYFVCVAVSQPNGYWSELGDFNVGNPHC